MSRVAIAAAWLALVGAAAPGCGVADAPIGRGFALSQYMYGGDSVYTLRYRPAGRAVTMRGLRTTGPVELTFGWLDFAGGRRADLPLQRPHVGIFYHPLARADGAKWVGHVRLACGGGVVLDQRYALAAPGEAPGPIDFGSAWSGQAEDACLDALRRDGRYALTLASDDGTATYRAEGRIPLARAQAHAEARWRHQTAAAARGRCTMPPVLPPPF